MRRKHCVTALPLVLIAVLLAGCGGSSGNAAEPLGGDGSNSISIGSNIENEAVNDVIGEVSYIGTYYISVKTYRPAAEIEDYVSLDAGTLTGTDSSDSINTGPDTEYYQAGNGCLVSIARENIAKGDMIAAITTETGVRQVIVLEN